MGRGPTAISCWRTVLRTSRVGRIAPELEQFRGTGFQPVRPRRVGRAESSRPTVLRLTPLVGLAKPRPTLQNLGVRFAELFRPKRVPKDKALSRPSAPIGYAHVPLQ